ncbi:undecaprenyl-diphosphate phosphatase [Oenococcus kitaharae]|uniref:Undecaprenyl-diphosphatase n=1 Tax=Oenococcus kitaharae DSM 17330 TaxID=1045004 RepID=G9WH86_9LACO|nr:undecaprenyl-diphosphate phosphatase [Oenococcus kitaharae]EHN59652.1 Undecaprenyl-diphosphatase [Oenococcus kitaharae DSM 17330]OEY83495.1 UDP pyrophosphate phosphatase [Oenococcus kitaharae]OEY85294.1 UDP pyrophosphate phosphatase [Oenococcus kitaharae]OEY86148.1 UDP pyrophosphate phosphatase [Oenococcus kitaharae]
MLFEILKAIVLGIVEGVTEFLPISSTGHLILVDEFVKISSDKAFTTTFEYVIQLGAIIAVVLLYWRRLWPFGNDKTEKQRFNIWATWVKVVVGVIPSVIIGFLLNDWMDQHLMTWQVVSVALIFYGIAFILIENFQKSRKPRVSTVSHLTLGDVIKIGLFQVLSIIPGTSRSGATILGGLSIGVSREAAAEFSFFLSIPTMLGVSVLKIGSYLHDHGMFSVEQIVVLLVGMVISFLVAYVVIKWLLRFIQTHDFKAFGWYRIILGVVVIIFGFLGVIH